MSSSGSSARWVCSRTSSRSASSAVFASAPASPRRASTGRARRGPSRPTRGRGAGRRGARSRRGSSSSSWTTESGGSPPSFCDRLIDPRVGWNRMPSSVAAAISARDEVAAALGVDVEVVGRRRAAAEGQLGQADPRREVGGLLVEPAPQRVERGEPAEQIAPCRRPIGPREVLVDVVMGVDQPGCHEAAVGSQHLGSIGLRSRGADPAHQAVGDRHPAAGDLPSIVVDGRHEQRSRYDQIGPIRWVVACIGVEWRGHGRTLDGRQPRVNHRPARSRSVDTAATDLFNRLLKMEPLFSRR